MENFQRLVQQLGDFPAKDRIDHLTSIARQMTSRHDISHAVNFLLLPSLANPRIKCLIPVLYLLDSILKNVGGLFIEESEPLIYQAFCNTFSRVIPEDQTRMYRMLKAWKVNIPPIFPVQCNELFKYLAPWIQQQAQKQAQIQMNPQQATYQQPQQSFQNPQPFQQPQQATYQQPQQSFQNPQPFQQPQQATYQQPQQSFQNPQPFQQPQQATYQQPQQSFQNPQATSQMYQTQQEALQSQPTPMNHKRGRAEEDSSEVVIRMRALLSDLQTGLTTTPMTLEELWQTDPDQAELLRAHAISSTTTQPTEEDEEESLVSPKRVRAVLEELKTLGEDNLGAKQCFEALKDGFRDQQLCSLKHAALAPPRLTVSASPTAAPHSLFALKHVCPEDNLHFSTPQKLATHQEVLSIRALQSKQAHSRGWGMNVNDWILEGRAETKAVVKSELSSPSSSSSSVSSKGTVNVESCQVVRGEFGESCRLCGEKFDTVFDDAKEEWMCRGVIEATVDGGEVGEVARVHVACADGAKVAKSLLIPSS